MSSYTIGQLAKAVGVPTSTLRYYERSGLLRPDFRTDGNYRAYSQESLERLRFIRAAQATGFSLHDVQEMLELTYSTEPPCKEVVTLMKNRLEEIRGRMKELRRVESALDKALKTCCRGGRNWCEEIERLKGPLKSGKPPKKCASCP